MEGGEGASKDEHADYRHIMWLSRRPFAQLEFDGKPDWNVLQPIDYEMPENSAPDSSSHRYLPTLSAKSTSHSYLTV